jgi:MFS family permease
MFPALKAELGLTDTQLGLTGSIFLWVYGIGCPIAGQLADRFSKRWLVVLSLAVWSAVTFATGLVGTAFALLALRAAMGVSEALYMPAAISLTANAHAPERRSRAIALLTTAQIFGTVGGAWFGGWMAPAGQLARGLLHPRHRGACCMRCPITCSSAKWMKIRRWKPGRPGRDWRLRRWSGCRPI